MITLVQVFWNSAQVSKPHVKETFIKGEVQNKRTHPPDHSYPPGSSFQAATSRNASCRHYQASGPMQYHGYVALPLSIKDCLTDLAGHSSPYAWTIQPKPGNSQGTFLL